MIKGLSERRRLPRAGKIRLGIMVQGAGGKMYPRATDYFVCPEPVQKVYGDKPTALTILFPVDDQAVLFPQQLKLYKKSGGLWCAGDGETAKRWSDAGELVERPCPCDFLESGECGPHATLNFFVDRVPGIGVWQLDTGNKTSIVQLNTGLEQALAAFGGLRGIPFILRLEPQETQRWDEGKRQMVRTTIQALRLDSEMTLREIVDWRRSLGKAVEALMPVTEVEPEDRVVEANGEPTREPDRPTANHRGAEAAGASGAPVAREAFTGGASADATAPRSGRAESTAAPQPKLPREAKADEPPIEEQDISLMFAWATRLGIAPEDYTTYLLGVYGTDVDNLPLPRTITEQREFLAGDPQTVRGTVQRVAEKVRKRNEKQGRLV